MRSYTSVADVPSDLGRTAVTIGKFDGLHAGHRAVIEQLLKAAETESLASVVVTFDRHPLQTLAPLSCPPSLVSVDQKVELLSQTGIDVTLILAFTKELASLEPEEFVTSILVSALAAKVVLVGRDFRFGAKGRGDVELLTSLGRLHDFEVQLIEDVRPDGDRRVSSTWIRELLREGDVQHAAELLGHVPAVRGIVVPGAKRGRELGFPTANLSPESEGLIPADGVYAGWLTDDADGRRYRAAISVGSNPTFEGVPPKQVEAYVLDEELDLYGHVVEVEFVERIRGMVKYTGVDPLIAQIGADVARVRELLP